MTGQQVTASHGTTEAGGERFLTGICVSIGRSEAPTTACRGAGPGNGGKAGLPGGEGSGRWNRKREIHGRGVRDEVDRAKEKVN